VHNEVRVSRQMLMLPAISRALHLALVRCHRAVVDRYRRPRRRVALGLAAGIVVAACGGASSGDGSLGDAGDLPGPLPSGIEFRDAPPGAISSPDFSAALLDGTLVTAQELWDDRPLVLVFTASWCARCAGVHREVANVVDRYDGAIALLGVVTENDDGVDEYARDLELGHPIAKAGEDVWVDYAADEPPLVALIAPGGKIMRGWPGGVDPDELSSHLEDLIEVSANEDGE